MPDVAAKFVWKLARRHSWGSPIRAEHLIQLVAGTEDHDQLKSILEYDVLTLPFVHRSSEGIYIPNGEDSHIAAAEWLNEHTELDELVIKATLSRLPNDWTV